MACAAAQSAYYERKHVRRFLTRTTTQLCSCRPPEHGSGSQQWGECIHCQQLLSFDRGVGVHKSMPPLQTETHQAPSKHSKVAPPLYSQSQPQKSSMSQQSASVTQQNRMHGQHSTSSTKACAKANTAAASTSGLQRHPRVRHYGPGTIVPTCMFRF